MRDDLHPEELLVRFAQCALSADEQEDLHAHLARCPVCALQLELRGAVAAALAPTEADYEIAARAVGRVLASDDWASNVLTLAPRASRDGARIVTRVAVVLAVLLGTGVGASAVVLGTRGRLWSWGRSAPVEVVSPPPARPSPHTRVARATGALVEVAPPMSAPAPTATPVIAALPVPAPHVSRATSTDGAEPEVIVPEAPVVVTPPAPAPARAPDLFAAAEAARRDGNAPEAQRLYGLLTTDFPGTREEVAARVLMGQTLLDDLQRPADALGSFEHYLREQPDGSLAEEARVGRAQALWRLGRAREEAAAWTELLARNPRSLRADLARSRLATLAATGE
jgi:hypothetical protein